MDWDGPTEEVEGQVLRPGNARSDAAEPGAVGRRARLAADQDRRRNVRVRLRDPEGGGFSVANVESHGAALELMAQYPLYGMVTWEVHPVLSSARGPTRFGPNWPRPRRRWGSAEEEGHTAPPAPTGGCRRRTTRFSGSSAKKVTRSPSVMISMSRPSARESGPAEFRALRLARGKLGQILEAGDENVGLPGDAACDRAAVNDGLHRFATWNREGAGECDGPSKERVVLPRARTFRGLRRTVSPPAGRGSLTISPPRSIP